MNFIILFTKSILLKLKSLYCVILKFLLQTTGAVVITMTVWSFYEDASFVCRKDGR